ncbi:MAG: Ig-like domain-containing protein [Colwellia sp.]|nr:Ig-like domain-containing protein [Colwellia sp.]
MNNGSQDKDTASLLCKLASALVIVTVSFLSLKTHAADLAPEQGVLLSIGQDVDSINDYHESISVVAGGVTNYIGINTLGGLTSNAESGAGRNNIAELASQYPYSTLVIGVSMNGVIDDVAAGHYNNNIDILLKTLASYQRPVYLRWAYEVDGPWNNHSNSAVISTFQYVHGQIEALGFQDSISLVWQVSSYCHNPAGQAQLEALWPGDEYVDWVGLSWFSPQDCNFERVNDAAQFARNHNKPLFINESSPQRYQIGELSYSSDAATGLNKQSKTAEVIWDEWYQPFFDFISDESNNVKAITYINADWDSQTRWNPTDGVGSPEGYWGDSRVQANEVIKQRWLETTNNEQFHQASNELFDLLGYSQASSNFSPELTITVPVAITPLGENIDIIANASDSDGLIASVALYHAHTSVTGEEFAEEMISSISLPPFSWALTDLEAGEHKITVVATDDLGDATTVLDRITVQGADENIIRLEAENGILSGDAQLYDDSDASNGSGIAYIFTTGSGVTFSDLSQSEQITIRYSSELAGTISIYINDQKHSLIFAPTGGWVSNYSYVVLKTAIDENSSMTLQFDEGDTAMNVDYIQLMKISIAVDTPTVPDPPPPVPDPADSPNDSGGSSGGSFSMGLLLLLGFLLGKLLFLNRIKYK